MPPPAKLNAPPNAYAAAQAILPSAEALVRSCFLDVQGRQATFESDPETGEQWIELRLTIKGTPAEVADAFDRYVSKWVAAVPWPQHNLVRLSYAIA
jgi:hypothetical protein